MVIFKFYHIFIFLILDLIIIFLKCIKKGINAGRNRRFRPRIYAIILLSYFAPHLPVSIFHSKKDKIIYFSHIKLS